jgi:hypothetical protein
MVGCQESLYEIVEGGEGWLVTYLAIYHLGNGMLPVTKGAGEGRICSQR